MKERFLFIKESEEQLISN